MSERASNDNRQLHELIMKQRREISVCGVKDSESCDETGAVMQTVDGTLTVEGEELKIGTLDTDRGVVSVTGRINGLYYTDERNVEKRGIISRLFK